MPITDETSSDSLSDHSREINPKIAQSKDDSFDYKMMYEELKQGKSQFISYLNNFFFNYFGLIWLQKKPNQLKIFLPLISSLF